VTAFNPEIRVMTLPPNTSHSATKTEVTSWVDYNINISRGTYEYINAPYPASCSLSLLFSEDYIPDIELGSWVEIQVKDNYNVWRVLQAGNVTNRSSSYRSHGVLGYVLEWRFTLTSQISLLQNTNYYVNQFILSTAEGLILYIEEEMYNLNWSSVNRNLTWANYGAQTWAEVGTSRQINFPAFVVDPDNAEQALDEGPANVWDDLVKLTYGVYGYIIEQPDGTLYFNFGDTDLTNEIVFTGNMLSPEIQGGDRYDVLRNIVTISRFDTLATTYYENESTEIYGDRAGTLETYLLVEAEANDIGQKILNSMAYPLLSTQQISMDLLNPNFTSPERYILLAAPLGIRCTVEAPDAMGGVQDYLTIGCTYSITKNSFILDLILAPYSQAFNTPNWEQIDYSYTWTSYGVAFPTQEWQDL
jgi:hypothetical protein